MKNPEWRFSGLLNAESASAYTKSFPLPVRHEVMFSQQCSGVQSSREHSDGVRLPPPRTGRKPPPPPPISPYITPDPCGVTARKSAAASTPPLVPRSSARPEKRGRDSDSCRRSHEAWLQKRRSCEFPVTLAVALVKRSNREVCTVESVRRPAASAFPREKVLNGEDKRFKRAVFHYAPQVYAAGKEVGGGIQECHNGWPDREALSTHSRRETAAGMLALELQKIRGKKSNWFSKKEQQTYARRSDMCWTERGWVGLQSLTQERPGGERISSHDSSPSISSRSPTSRS
ncbi:hypothetical protein P4O66_020919 [Electrophorus voltai]|uniref:Uncharacterized protein n=1 Tax=Electrophorus voltai TaxID=2609070 RepID=A0AAD9E387_9TELE|nr:hypothetical protein P4O66_020919 [Electrophorus voltai]